MLPNQTAPEAGHSSQCKEFGNQPAFPNEHVLFHPGLTKREYFAAIALQGLLAQESEHWNFFDNNERAHAAIAQADALIAALQPPQS